MMKIKKFGALLVSAVLCIGMAAPAFAYEGDTTPVEEPVLPEIVEEEDAVTITDEETGALTPEGNLTLVDDYYTNYSDGSGQQFITMVSKSGATFYLVIDRNAKGQQTVHFMNLVDEADLLALMEEEDADAYTAEKEAAAQAEQDKLKAEEEAKKVAEEAAASGTEQPKENKVTKIASGFLGVVVLIALATGGGLFFYLWFIKSGNFVKLANELEINLMYRDVIYTYFSDFFELVPTYIGRGIRFIYTYCTEDPSYHLAVTALHNVYMETYIEVGFWCWWIWILFELAFRIHRVEERYTEIPAYALMSMNLYVFGTYLTDNTLFYYAINVLYRMAIMEWCLEVSENSDLLDSEMQPLKAVQEGHRQKGNNKWKVQEKAKSDFHICM